MDNALFSQAINRTFPNLDQAMKEEMLQKVQIHMLEFLRAKVFRETLEKNVKLLKRLEEEQDMGEEAVAK